MDQFGKELEKMVKAGIGAVSTGLEKGSEALEKLAQKGEPLYQQAKESVCCAAGKIKKAVDDCNIPDNLNMMFGGKVTVAALTQALKQFSKEELDEVRSAIDEMYEAAPDQAAPEKSSKEASCKIESSESDCSEKECICKKEESEEENTEEEKHQDISSEEESESSEEKDADSDKADR